MAMYTDLAVLQEKYRKIMARICWRCARAIPKTRNTCWGVRPFRTYAHGLYCLARLLLPEDKFQALEMPKYNNFLPAFALCGGSIAI